MNFVLSKAHLPQQVRYFLLSCILMFVMAHSPQSLWAQTPQLTIEAPQNNASGIAVNTDIVVKTNRKIDTSSFDAEYPELHTTTANARPVILVLAKEQADSHSSAIWHAFAHGSGYTLQNDTTLVLHLHRLSYGSEYTVNVKGLWADSLSPSWPAVEFPETEINFTTVLPPEQLTGTSLDGWAVVDCDDKIYTTFNRDIQTTQTSTGTLLTISKITSLTMIGSSGASISTASVTASLNIEADARMVSITPSGLQTGEDYFLHVNTSVLTGNPADDRRIPFRVQSNYRLRLETLVENSSTATVDSWVSDVLGEGDSYPAVGETVELFTLDKFEDMVFQRWECDEIPAIDGSSSNTISFSQPCGDAPNITVRAVYQQASSTTIQVIGHSGMRVLVYNAEHEYLGGPGVYTVYDMECDSLLLVATGSGGVNFGGWNTSSPPPPPPFNPWANPQPIHYQPFVNVGWISANPNYNPPQVDYTLCGSVVLDGQGNVGPGTIYTYTTPQCDQDTYQRNGSVGITILDPCYEIVEVFQGGVWTQLMPPQQAITLTDQLTQTGNKVIFRIARKQISLRVEKVMTKNTLTEVEDPDVHVNHANAAEVFKMVGGVWVGPLAATVRFDPITNKPYDEYRFNCGDMIKIEVNDNKNEGHYFSHWSNMEAGYIIPGNREATVLEIPASTAYANFTAIDGVTPEIRTRTIWESIFKCIEVGLYLRQKNGTYALTYMPPEGVYVHQQGEPNDGRQVRYFQNEGSRIHFHFNKPLKKASVHNQTPSSLGTDGGIGAVYHLRAIDYPGGSQYSIYNNISYYDHNQSGKVNALSFSQKGFGTYMHKMSHSFILLSEQIQSLAGEPLDNPFNFGIELELPRVTWTYKSLKKHGDKDFGFWDDSDLFTVYQSAILEPDEDGYFEYREYVTDRGQHPECQGDCADDVTHLGNNETETYNHPVLSSARALQHYSVCTIGMEVRDEDGAGLINAVGTVLQTVASALEIIKLPKLPERKNEDGEVIPPDFWTSILHGYGLEVGALLLNSIGEWLENASNHDDYMGNVKFLETKHNKWGWSYPNHQMVKRSHQSTITITVDLY